VSCGLTDNGIIDCGKRLFSSFSKPQAGRPPGNVMVIVLLYASCAAIGV
jgi:hypothetical protein